MKHLMIFIAALGILFLTGRGAAQNNPPVDSNGQTAQQREAELRREEARRRWDKLNGKDERGMIADRGDFTRGLPPRTKPDGKPYSRKELEQIEALKRPAAADLAGYADFLEQSKTGMFRLFPFLPCLEKNLVRADGECADYVHDSWAYSFRAKGYTNQLYFDLKYKNGKLIGGGMLSLGVITTLGDVPLENVSLASDGMKFLAELKPEAEQSEKQLKDFLKGVDSGGYKYSSKTDVAENTTYGLRVVAYRMPRKVRLILDTDAKLRALIPKYSHPLNTSDNRDDIVVAFRVLRKEKDGNVTIVWKELRRTDSPELVFPKDVKSVFVRQNEN